MKIVKRVGERLLPSWIRAEVRPVLVFTGAGSALWAGSVVLARRGWDELGEHLDWRERIGVLAFAGYVAAFGCWQAPHIARFAVPGAAVAWCLAAWWIAPPARLPEPVEDAPEGAETGDPQDVYDATLAWIWERIGDTQGVHLRDLLTHAQAHGMFKGLEVTDLRAHLERWDIPVRKRVRVRGLGITVGIHRDDLPAPSPAPSEPEGQEPPESELHPV